MIQVVMRALTIAISNRRDRKKRLSACLFTGN